MISFLNHFKISDLGYTDVEIYPDDQDDQVFYYLRHDPKFTTDAVSGMPMFNFIYFVHPPSASQDLDEQASGSVNLTIDLGLTPEEEIIVREALVREVRKNNFWERQRVLWRRVWKLGPILDPRKIKLSPVNCEGGSGTVSFTLYGHNKGSETDFVRDANFETKPDLGGDHRATLAARLSGLGATAIYNDLQMGEKKDEKKLVDPSAVSILTTGFTVSYDLVGHAKMPGLKAKITAHASEVYSRFKSINPDGTLKQYTKTEIEEMLNSPEFNGSVDVEIDDNGILLQDERADCKDVLKNLISFATDDVLKGLFQSVAPSEDLGGQFPKTGLGNAGDSDTASCGEVYYTLKSEKEIGSSLDFTVTLDYQAAVPLHLTQNGSLFLKVTEEQKKSMMRIISLGNTPVMFRNISVSCQVSDFKEDNISAVFVHVEYSHPDHLFKGSKHVLFEDGKTSFMFPMQYPANTSKEEEYKTYRYRTGIQYVSGAPYYSEWKTSKEEVLLVTYESLGYLKVVGRPFDIDWRFVKEARVTLKYKPLSIPSNRVGLFKLTESDGAFSWTCPKNGDKSNAYTYQVQYLLWNDKEIDGPTITTESEELNISDLFHGVLTSHFNVNFDPSLVSQVTLEIDHDGRRSTHDFLETGSYDWSDPIMEGDSEQFTYRYITYYQSSKVEETPWSAPVQKGSSVPPMNLHAKNAVSIMVDGDFFPWENWNAVYVTVRYADDLSPINKRYRLDSNNRSVNEVLQVKSDTGSFLCSFIYLDKDGKQHPVPEKEYPGGLVILEEPAND